MPSQVTLSPITRRAKMAAFYMKKQKGADAMLIVSKRNVVSLTRGDSATLRANADYEDGQPYTVKEDDVVTFTLKKNCGDSEALIKKELTGSNLFHFKPEDTAGLAFGRYRYDVQVTTVDGDNYTIIEDTEFNITKEV